MKPYAVVIAVDRIDKPLPSVESLAALPKKERPSEILLSVGRNPSVQRNQGVSACRSPWVYFLDDDSHVIPGTASHLMSHFDEARVAVAGGPNLPFPDATPFEKSVSAVLASWLGSFKVRSRYASLGSVRETTEKELILCNLMMRRDVFLKEGGFRTDLYPNEENEFLNRLLHHEYGLLYDPQAVIYRPRRKTLGAFIHQSFRYGRGRGQQIRVYPCLSDIVHLVPAFFFLYVLILATSFFLPSSGPFQFLKSVEAQAPMILFGVAALATGISGMSWHRQIRDFFLIPFLIFLRQSFYGLGLLAGLLGPRNATRSTDVALYRVRFERGRLRFQPLPRRKKS